MLPFPRLSSDVKPAGIVQQEEDFSRPSSTRTMRLVIPQCNEPSTSVCDNTSTVSEGEVCYYACKDILTTFSSVFSKMLSSTHFIEAHQQSITLPGKSAKDIHAMLRFMHCHGRLFYGKKFKDSQECLALLSLADEYDIEMLKEWCVNYMEEELRQQSEWGGERRAVEVGELVRLSELAFDKLSGATRELVCERLTSEFGAEAILDDQRLSVPLKRACVQHVARCNPRPGLLRANFCTSLTGTLPFLLHLQRDSAGSLKPAAYRFCPDSSRAFVSLCVHLTIKKARGFIKIQLFHQRKQLYFNADVASLACSNKSIKPAINANEWKILELDGTCTICTGNRHSIPDMFKLEIEDVGPAWEP